ncbi:hypothetical protein [uncultured Nostoc sp.]|uniref:hypothetical protein n=1 Tax=uncultured Nostoc sp. TaxID=340711 RepID=UPI0035C9D42C
MQITSPIIISNELEKENCFGNSMICKSANNIEPNIAINKAIVADIIPLKLSSIIVKISQAIKTKIINEYSKRYPVFRLIYKLVIAPKYPPRILNKKIIKIANEIKIILIKLF